MAVTSASFLLAYDEFAKAGTSKIAAALADAELLVSDSFGDQRDRAVMLTCAHLLAVSPAGRDARMFGKGVNGGQFVTIYQAELDRMAGANAVTASRMGSRRC